MIIIASHPSICHQHLKFCVEKSGFQFVARWHLVCTYSSALYFPILVSATMAAPPTVTEQALRKLEDQLTCGICHDSYTEPKLLQCFHVFCKQCLECLVVCDHQGLSLQCPSCCRSTLLPPTGASGLQAAFYLNNLFEVRDTLVKVKEPQKTQCGKCKKRVATSFCCNCGQFICARCTETHQEWEELSSHKVITLNQLEEDVSKLVPPKKVMFCSKHPTKELDLYCETCEELICQHCTVRVHRDHQYDLVTDAFQKHKDVLVTSLQPVEQQLDTVTKSLQQLDTQCQQITDQREALVGNIHKTIQQLQEALELRRTELIGQLDNITQQKLKSLAAQRDQVELVQTQLNSCLDFVKESLRTGSEGEILAMKKPVVKQVEEITAEFKAEILAPQERADIRFSASTPELTQTCQQFGQVYSNPASPERCYATGKGLEIATVGEQATAILHAMDADGKECEQPLVNTSCELVSDTGGPTVKGAIQKKEKNKYTIRYQPTHRGRYQLYLKVEGVSIRGSPFAVIVVKNLSTPIRTIASLNQPWGVAVNHRGEIIVAEYNGNCISIFSPSGEKIRTFGSKGSTQGQFREPRGVAVDGDRNILVADESNHRIQKFTEDGKFLTAVGQRGNNHLEFLSPFGVAVNHRNRKVYISDRRNNRIQVLNADLTFSSSFGSQGIGDGKFNFPWGVAFNSTGNVYVVDSDGHRIQVFTSEGKFLRMFGKKGSGDGELNFPTSVTIDSDDTVYVTECNNRRVSMFTSEGQFLRSFGTYGEGPGQFYNPRGIAVDRDGFVYVSDTGNDRIQIF